MNKQHFPNYKEWLDSLNLKNCKLTQQELINAYADEKENYEKIEKDHTIKGMESQSSKK